MSEAGKIRQILLYAAPFVPLAFFKTWSSLGPSPAAMAAAAWVILAYFVGLIIVSYRVDKPSYFDWAIGVYFALLALGLLLAREQTARVITAYPVTGIYACLFAASFLPPLFGFPPFTYHYAKRYSPRTVWQNPVFARVNTIMTYSWSVIFAVSAALSLYPSVVTRAIVPLAFIVGFGIPFNIRFPNYYLRRLGLPTLAEQKKMAGEGPRPAPLLSIDERSRFSTARDAIAGMASAFNPQAAGALQAIIGFHVTGSESFDAYLHIQGDTCSFEDRAPGVPDLLIRTPADVWLAVSTGRLSGQEAFIRGAYTAEGDLSILMRMGQLFSAASTAEDTSSVYRVELAPPAQPESVAASTAFIQPQPQKEATMRVLVSNSSPRAGGQSKTELMLRPFTEGMQDGGAEVETIHLRTKKVKNCVGCFTCWTKTPGVCAIKDDMTAELFPKWAKADLVVYASPLYYFGVNAEMKTFIERTLPALQPFFETGGGVTRHPWRIRHPKVVIISVAGFPEYSAFDLLSQWIRFTYSGVLAAEIYRPGAEFLAQPPFREKALEILAAVRRAGRELVTEGSINPNTLEAVRQPVSSDTETALKIGNAMWKTCIDEGITPREMDEKGMVPRPDSLEAFMAIMPLGFNPEKAGDTKAIIQFDFSGNTEGSCHFRIENRTIKALSGKAEKADLTIDAPFDTWMDIMTGKAGGQQMLMEGKYKATGDLSLLIRMNQLFSGKHK